MTNLKTLIFALSMAFFTSNSIAKERSCLEMFKPFERVSFVLDSDQKDAAFANELKTIGAIQEQLFYKGLQSPDPIKLEISRTPNIARYMNETNTVTISKVISLEENELSPRQIKAIFVHELTHAFFHQNMLLRSPVYKKNLEKWDELKDERAGLDKIFISAYNELFADIGSVLFSKDLDVAWKASGGKERSFTVQEDPELWEGQSPYHLLTPARYEIGKLLTNTSYLEKTKLMSDILDIFIEQIDVTRKMFTDQYDNDPSLAFYEYEVPVSEINKNLIEAIRKLN